MATVADLSGNTVTDKSLVKPNRTNAGDPNGSLTPEYQGEIVLDTTNKKLWRAETMLNTGWVTLNRNG